MISIRFIIDILQVVVPSYFCALWCTSRQLLLYVGHGWHLYLEKQDCYEFQRLSFIIVFHKTLVHIFTWENLHNKVILWINVHIKKLSTNLILIFAQLRNDLGFNIKFSIPFLYINTHTHKHTHERGTWSCEYTSINICPSFAFAERQRTQKIYIFVHITCGRHNKINLNTINNVMFPNTQSTY